MNCQRFESVINELAREHIVETSVRDDALEHCSHCAKCAGSLAAQRVLTVALRGLANEWQSVEAPHTVQESLIAALRSRAATPAVSPMDYRWRYWAGAIAAVLLIFVAVGAMFWRQEWQEPVISKSSGTAKAAAEVKPTETAAVDASAPQPEIKEKPADGKVERSNSRHRRLRPAGRENMGVQTTNATAVADYGSNEIATEFLPLGYGNPLSLPEGGQIVRVEVPRSTLVSFGLPVNMDRVGQRVKADLLLGVDGSARAIRFVQ